MKGSHRRQRCVENIEVSVFDFCDIHCFVFIDCVCIDYYNKILVNCV